MIILNNELFDAYPIDVFVYKDELGWCEKLVDVVNPKKNTTQRLILNKNDDNMSSSSIILNQNDTSDSKMKTSSDLKFVYSNKSPNIQKILKPTETFKFMNISNNDSYEISMGG